MLRALRHRDWCYPSVPIAVHSYSLCSGGRKSGGIEVFNMARQRTRLTAFAFLFLAGCSSDDSAATSGGRDGATATGGTTADTLAAGGLSSGGSDAVSTGGSTAVDAAGGGDPVTSATGGDAAGLGGELGGGGAAASPAGGGTPNTGGSEMASGGAYVPATGGVINYVAIIPPDALIAEAPVCGVQDFELETQPAEVLLLLDRSSSMSGSLSGGALTRWEGIVPTVASVVQATSASLWWGLKTYPERSDVAMCDPESIVPTIHVPIAEDSAAAVIAQIEATGPDGSGTPTGDAVRFGMAHLVERTAVSANPKYILLATDGEPSCPMDGAIDPLDFAIEQISAALAAGFPTFVLGVDTTSPATIANLNAMAVAGGRPQVGSTESFYLASTQAEIEVALQAIAGEIASCVFDLEPPPPVPDNIAVDFSGSRVEKDPSLLNGWDYTTDDYTQLEVFGPWCERIQTEAMNRVNIKYGCPGVPIPLPE